MLELSRYTADRASEWDAFVDQARNGHFFFKRGYLDYHADRFSDHSLIIARAGRTEALLPANRTADAVYSHQGLTYGGLLVGEQGGARISEALGLIAASLAAEGVSSLFYKSMPHIYHRQPAEEDLYVLHRLGARLVRRELSSAICLQAPRRYSKGKTGNLRRASTAEITFGRDYDATSFMTLLQETLRSRHDATPTHSLEELARLMRAFPENIRLYSARRQGRYLAGAVVFINHAVVHTQYLANSDEGREVGALDFIIDTLISREFSGSRWFSFGISTTDGGRELNEGLLHHKEAFGARGIVHDMYVLDVKGVAR